MADTKVSALTAATIPAEADLVYVVVGGTVSRKMVLSDLFPGFTQTVLGRRTSGDLVLGSSTWINVDTGLDLVIPGTSRVGDLVQVGVSIHYASALVQSFLDFVSLDGVPAPVNSWAQDGVESVTATGISALIAENGFASNNGGSIIRALVSGDLQSGVLTLRLRYRGSSATSRTLLANTNVPLHVWAINHGQPKT